MRDSRDAGARKEDRDAEGRLIHRVGGRRQVTQHVDQEYVAQWADDRKIRKDVWGNFMAAAMIGKTTAEEMRESARMADAAYQELMLRERGRFDEI